MAAARGRAVARLPALPAPAGFHRTTGAQREPAWFNAPVPTFLPPEGDERVRLLIVGLAPGLRGANRTGRPFTGDYAGDLLYRTLIRFGFAARRVQGAARRRAGAGRHGDHQCGALRAAGEQAGRRRDHHLPAVPDADDRALSRISRGAGARRHRASVDGAGARRPRRGACRSSMARSSQIGRLTLFSSYHCSRYNTNTGVLTEEMFVNVFREIAEFRQVRLGESACASIP